MIIDRLERAGQYHGINARIDQALEYLQHTDFSQLAPGKYALDGDNLYAIVMNYTTSASEGTLFEAHRQYIDVQYVAAGVERMAFADLDTLTVTEEYDELKDALMLSGEGDLLTARAGTFVIFWPADAHIPCKALNEPQPVTKVVVKVKGEEGRVKSEE